MSTPGSKLHVLFGVESTYGTAVSTTKVMDLVTRVTPRITNNEIKSGGLGTKDMQGLAEGHFEATLSLEGQIELGYPLIYAIGAATPAGSAPYVHTIAPASPDEVPSLTIEVGVDQTTDSVQKYIGCRMNTLTLRFTEGAVLEYIAEFFVKDITESVASIGTLTPLSEKPMVYHQGALEIPDATVIAEVLSGELVFSNQLYRNWACDSRKGNDFGGWRDYTYRFDINFINPNLLDDTLGADGAVGSTVPTMSWNLTFTNGLAGALMRKIDILTETAFPNEWGLNSAIDQVVVEDISGSLKLLDGDASNLITLSNNTAVM